MAEVEVYKEGVIPIFVLYISLLPIPGQFHYGTLTMLSSLLSLAALLTPAIAIVEPLNTTILGPYGFVPPVYPSRKS